MVDAIMQAVSNIDWRYVTLSRLLYDGSNQAVGTGERHWLERPFAYEIYHQLRCLWRDEHFETACIIQAEVLKSYQEIRHLNKMPDFLFHIPDTGRNAAVVEIKLASNSKKQLEDDLDKLALFHRVLRYELLVEILIGSNEELEGMQKLLAHLDGAGRTPIHVVCLSLNDHQIKPLQIRHKENRRADLRE